MRVSGEVAGGLRAALVVAASSLFVVLVAWGTLVGPSEVFTGPGPRPATATTTAPTCIPLPETTAPDGSTTVVIPDDAAERDYCDPPDTSLEDATRMVSDADVPWWAKVVVWALEALLVGAMLALLVWGGLRLREALRQRPTRERAADDVEFAVLGEPARLAAAVVGDAAEQDALLRDGEPRNAIVAAWTRFEVQGARAGSPRREWETSSEYALRILDLVEADEGAVHRLAGLYREARFSEHPITEQHRQDALSALEAIRRSLGVRP